MMKWNGVLRTLMLMMLPAVSVTAWGQVEEIDCQIVDRFDDTLWDVYGGFTDEVAGDGFRNLGIIEAGAGTWIYYDRTRFGEFDLNLRVDSLFFTGRGVPRLPEHLTATRLDLEYTVRMPGYTALRLGVAPGLYSELHHVGSDHLFVPFRVHGVYAPTLDASILAGVNVYPGFDQLIDPRVGIRWEMMDNFLLDLFYPKSEIAYRADRGLGARVGVEMREYLEYRLRSSDERKGLTINEYRAFAGVDYTARNGFRLMVLGGYAFDRELEFRNVAGKLSLDDAWFFRVGSGGAL